MGDKANGADLTRVNSYTVGKPVRQYTFCHQNSNLDFLCSGQPDMLRISLKAS